MKQVIAFKRPHDGKLFTLNSDGITYSLEMFKEMFPKQIHSEYSKEKMLECKFIPIYENKKASKKYVTAK